MAAVVRKFQPGRNFGKKILYLDLGLCRQEAGLTESDSESAEH